MIESTPPHESATESCFLDGVMMADSLEQAERWCANLVPDDFYTQDHRELFEVIQTFVARGEAPVFTSVAEECRAAFDVAGSSVSSAHVGDYRARLLSASRKRFLRTQCQSILERLSDADLEPLRALEEAAHAFSERFVDESSNFARPIGDCRDEFGVLLAKVRAGEQGIAGRSTGYPSLDKLVAGLQGGRLYICAARTGAGKTTFVANLAHQMASGGTHTGFFSLEMGAQEIFHKMVAVESGVDMFRLRQGQIDPAGLVRATAGADTVSTLPIYVNDGHKLGLSLIERDCARLKQANQLDLVIVDYLQLMWTPPSRKQRYEAVGELSRGLKQLARKLDVPVVACAQLSRKADEGDGEPKLSHLRESGSLEQDADSVWMMWRDGMGTKFKVAKNRNGPTGRLEFQFDQERERFTEGDGKW